MIYRLLMEVGTAPTFFLSEVCEAGRSMIREKTPGNMAPKDADPRDVIEEIWSLASPVIRSEGMELIEVEYRRESQGWVLRLFVDKADGVTVDDCAAVSHVLGDLLDVADPISVPYHLEVSSPGLDRPLRKWEHFRRQIGNVVTVRTREALEARKNFKGTLVDADPDFIQVNCDGVVFTIPLKLIDRARLCYFESPQSGRDRIPSARNKSTPPREH